MKKLMITAAAAAVGLTSFGEELCYDDLVGDGCAVYNVKFTFKTLAAKKNSNCGLKWLINDDRNMTWLRTDIAGVSIEDATTVAGGVHDQTIFPHIPAHKRELWWADNATRTFDGILWQCTAACFEGNGFRGLTDNVGGRINFALWEKQSKTTIAYPVLRYWTNKNRSRYGWWTRDAQWDFDFLGRYGQTAQKVAAYWTPGIMRGWIEAAGFGTFDKKNLRITSVSGNAVGMIAPLNTGAKDACGRDSKFFVQVAFMCQDFIQWCCDGCYAGVELVPASGTWSIKYNASLSKGTKSLAKILPDYAVFGPAIFGSAGWARIRNFVNNNFYNVVLDSNGIFYAPRYFEDYMVDEEGEKIEPALGGDNEVEQYLEQLALRANQVMDFELYADLDGNEYVLTQLAWDKFEKTADGKSYKWNGTDVLTYNEEDKKWEVAEGDEVAQLNYSIEHAWGVIAWDTDDEGKAVAEEAYPDGTKEGESDED